jgi:hypothetical protein
MSPAKFAKDRFSKLYISARGGNPQKQYMKHTMIQTTDRLTREINHDIGR